MKPLALSVNVIHNKRFIHAGEILDTDTLATLPATFKKYLVPADSESDQEPEQVVTNFQLNTSYGVSREGRLLARHLQQQAAEACSAADFQDAMEAQLAHEIQNPDPTTAAALAAAADDYDASVSLQIAQAEVNAKRQDDANEYLEERQRKSAAQADDEGFSPSLDEENQDQPNGVEPEADWRPQPKPPRKMRKRYVNRNGIWLRVKRLKRFQVGEPVFVKDSGKFVEIGRVNKNGKPPACYMEE